MDQQSSDGSELSAIPMSQSPMSRSSLVSCLTSPSPTSRPERFVDGLKAAGVEFFAGVPDSLLKSFCAYVTDARVVKGATTPLLLHQWGQTL